MDNPYDHSRMLDVHIWSDHPEVNIFVDAIYDAYFLGGNEGIRKRHLKVVLLDLYVAWKEDPELCIAVHRDVNFYKARSRYNALHISKLTIKVIDLLVEAEFICFLPGFHDEHRGGSSRVSRIWPTDKLINLFREARFGLFDVQVHLGQECIVLRDIDPATGKKFDKEYDDTGETRRMRAILEKYNSLLSETYIDIPSIEANFIDLGNDLNGRPSRLYVNQRDKFVRRIFNRGSWEKGGRFWGGWWQRCPSEWRSTIFLDDQPSSELDYSGLHVVLLSALAGIDYWEQVGTDPYVIAVPELDFNQGQLRSICKQLVLVALNAQNLGSAFQAFRNNAETSSLEKTLKNDQLFRILICLREKHAPIADKFCSDAGIDLMNIDGRITEHIIEHFTTMGLPILTIHDSYIVPRGMEQELEERMAKAFEEVCGIRNVKLKKEYHEPMDYEPLDEGDAFGFDFAVLEQAVEYREDPPRSERYQHQLGLFRQWLDLKRPDGGHWPHWLDWIHDMGPQNDMDR